VLAKEIKSNMAHRDKILTLTERRLKKMKFNFKKIASVLATTVMLGSTVAFAAAAWPAPLVNSGAADAAIVYGSTGSDMAAVTSVADALNAKVTSTGAVSASEGDKIKLEKSSNKFNLGDAMNAFYSTLDEEELTKVLATGTYMDDDNNEYDYEQSIAIGALTLTHFEDDDFNDAKPVVGFDLTSGDHVLNYSLEFTPDAAKINALETSTITMLGTSYYVLSNSTTSNGLKLTLLDNANSALVSEGETKTVTVGDKTYSIDIVYVGENDAILEVNGVKTNKLAEGGVFKVATDTYVAVKSILYSAKDTGISQVEFSVGSGKIVLENATEVEMNDKPISDSTDMILNAYFTNSASELTKLVLEWNLDDDFWIAPGTDLVLPGFKTIKLSMAGFNAPKQEVTSLKASSDEIFEVKTTIKDGELDLPLFYTNSTDIVGLGEKAKHKLVTNDSTNTIAFTLNVTENSYFVVSYLDGDSAESYAYELDTITDNDGKNSTTLKNLAGGSDVTFSEVGKDKDIGDGNINLALTAADKDTKIAVVTATKSGGDALYADRVFTKEGMTFKLPVVRTLNAVVTDGQIFFGNATAGTTAQTWTMNFTEETKDGNIQQGESFTTTLGVNADDGLEPTVITGITTYETEDGSKKYEGYQVSDLATKVLWDKPSSGLKSLEVTYAGDQSTADVYVSEAAVSFTGSDSIKIYKDTEVDTVKDKNLVVIGGSCINTVAAKLLGSDTPVCGAAFTAKTNVAAGQYLLKVAASPYNAQKVALLIAGYEAADTKTAADLVAKEGTSMEVGETVGPKLA
jgi:hypothetical protein